MESNLKKTQKELTKISHKLSKFLRHEMGKKQTKVLISPNGYCPIHQLLFLPSFNTYTIEDIKEVSAQDSKQRYHIMQGPPHPDTADLDRAWWWIRANQGHSFQLSDPGFESITLPEQIPVVIHGTSFSSWKLIMGSSCLKRMGRTHIHFAPGLPGESGVISGMRTSCDVYIYIDVAAAMIGGISFFRSANNVILSPGIGNNGVISNKFFSKVVDKKGNSLI